MTVAEKVFSFFALRLLSVRRVEGAEPLDFAKLLFPAPRIEISGAYD